MRFVVLLAMGFGCAEPAACIEQPVVGGLRHESFLMLTEAQLAAVVELRATLDAEEARCSAVLVGPRHLLTAAHCAPILEAHARTSLPGEPSVQILAVHPEADLLLAELEEPAEVPPLAIADETFLAPGDRAVVAGFGRTGTHVGGRLRVATQRVVSVADTLVVTGAGGSGVCSGDSGGPLLARDDEGALRIVGVLERGSLSCRARGRFRNLSTVRRWLWEHGVAPAATSPTLEECEDYAGQCVRGRVVRCLGRVITEACGAHERCSEETGTAECALAEACDEPAFGSCAGDRLVQCVGGRRVETRCSSACGGPGTCGFDPQNGAAVCLRAP